MKLVLLLLLLFFIIIIISRMRLLFAEFVCVTLKLLGVERKSNLARRKRFRYFLASDFHPLSILKKVAAIVCVCVSS